ncbi:VOC family protein [Mycolicibacterium septicum]|uniref:VOC family protein n=1 Tax=Mycolicibacterium septicum TaxID=98668 RepID=UPI001AF5AEE2|nr:VOC family protein [Mycolicibacterium septicum]QRY53101.1 glyoxalase [Mycolicibacterium septicum]
MTPAPAAPAGFSTINPFIVTRDAAGLIRFLADVFDGVDHPDARTVDDDGLLLHAELQIGGSTVMFAERKPDWPFTPALLQVYVDDVEVVLDRAAAGGAEIITRPTEFYGDTFSRFLDPWHNLWWVYRSGTREDIAQDSNGGESSAGTDWSDNTDGSAGWEPTPELAYIHDTLLQALPKVRDPHSFSTSGGRKS